MTMDLPLRASGFAARVVSPFREMGALRSAVAGAANDVRGAQGGGDQRRDEADYDEVVEVWRRQDPRSDRIVEEEGTVPGGEK